MFKNDKVLRSDDKANRIPEALLKAMHGAL